MASLTSHWKHGQGQYGRRAVVEIWPIFAEFAFPFARPKIMLVKTFRQPTETDIMHHYRLTALVVGFGAIVAIAADAEKITGANYALATKFNADFVKQHVRDATVSPQWIGKTDVFWYGVRTPEGTKYWRVDPGRKAKEPLFDLVKLAARFAEVSQRPVDAATLDITRVTVDSDGAKMKFVVGDTQYELELATHKLSKLGAAPPLPKGGFGKGGFRKDDERRDDERKDEERKDDEEKKNDEEKKVEGKKDDSKTGPKRGPGGRFGGDYKAYSPDRKKYVYAFKHNLFLADDGKEAEAVQLTTDGEEDYSFASTFGGGGGRTSETAKMPKAEAKTRPAVVWSSDSKCFHIQRSDLRGVKDLFLINSLSEPRPTLVQYKYPMPGEEAVRRPELFVCDATARKLTRVKPRWVEERYGNVEFGKTGDELRFVRRDRLQRHLDYVAYDVKTHTSKVLLSEAFEGAFLDYQTPRQLPDTNEFIWWSERSGWGHFYLYATDGTLKNAITSGAWRASVIVDVDTKNRLLYFRGNAREAGENIYYQHLYRVRFDGTDLTCMDPSSPVPTIQADGQRGWNQTTYLAPSKRFAVVNSSRVDAAPFATLVDDKGKAVMPLESTDLTRLQQTGWRAPEVFTVKAADGVTELYGNMWKPFDFDPKKKYPIIAYVYPGPQQEGLTQTFTAYSTYMQLAQLGFIVIQSGHRGGAPTRSKAYHSYGYFNLRDYGLADKKATIEQLAARHAFIDIERVGIYGHSGGGFMSAAALLQKPYNEFFKVAVASAGNHDNNIYNDNWSERYHGLKEVPTTDTKEKEKGKAGIPPAKPDDAEQDDEENVKDGKKDTKKDDGKGSPAKPKLEIRVPTNAELAANLKGHLLLVHGDMDNNVHPAGTIRLVDALIKANKRFDMLILPGKAHGFADYQPYFTQRLWEYFALHLLDDRQTSADILDKKSNRK